MVMEAVTMAGQSMLAIHFHCYRWYGCMWDIKVRVGGRATVGWGLGSKLVGWGLGSKLAQIPDNAIKSCFNTQSSEKCIGSFLPFWVMSSKDQSHDNKKTGIMSAELCSKHCCANGLVPLGARTPESTVMTTYGSPICTDDVNFWYITTLYICIKTVLTI